MLFGTDGLRGRVNQEITAPIAMRVGFAVVRTLGQRVLVAHDGRPSAPMLQAALVAGIAAMGGEAVCVGLLPTPGVSVLVAAEGYAAGVMITASHNPPTDNGLKVVDSHGCKPNRGVRERMEAVLGTALGAVRFPERVGIIGEDPGAAERYAGWLVERFARPGEQPLRGARLIVDLANGAARSVAPTVLVRLGAEVEVLGRRGGEHINEGCGALHPASLARRVVATGADAGIALDGDGDRVVVVDHEGHRLDGDSLLWLASGGLSAGSVVVGTVMTNLGLERALAARGLVLQRTQVGDHAVAEAMTTTGARLGGEPSGHVLWADGPPTSDGLYTALRALLPEPRALRALAAGWARYHQAHRVLQIGAATLPTLPNELIGALEASGARVVVRPSGTEPVLRIMVEHADRQAAEDGAAELALAIGQVLG